MRKAQRPNLKEPLRFVRLGTFALASGTVPARQVERKPVRCQRPQGSDQIGPADGEVTQEATRGEEEAT